MTMSRTRCTAIIALAALPLLLPACGISSVITQPDTRASVPATPTSTPATLTVEEARTIYTRYVRLADHATHTNGDGLEQAEAGLALELSRAQIHLATLRKQPPATQSANRNVQFAIPRTPPGRHRWFLAVRDNPGASGQTQLIFAQTAHGWRLVAASATPAGDRLPQLDLNQDGHAVALGEKATGLAATPHQIARAHAASLASGNSHPQSRALLAPGTYTTEAAKDIQGEADAIRGQWSLRISTRTLPGIYALRTRDGGAMAWYALRETQTYTRINPLASPITFTKPNPAALSHGRSFTRRADVAAASWFLAVIPPAGTGAKSTIIGDWYITLSVDGS
jgi:hypothetical protein